MAIRRHKILIVDEDIANLGLLSRLFGQDYEVFEAKNGENALSVLKKEPISLVITAQRMPKMTGVQLLERSIAVRPEAIRILLTDNPDVQSLIDAINLGSVYKFFAKPYKSDELKLTVKTALETRALKVSNNHLSDELKQALHDMEELTVAAIRALADALDAKCDYTSGHSLRVSRIARIIAKEMQLSPKDLKDIELAGILHDVGKIGVPDSILWKPARLTDEEMRIMAEHPVKSAQIIAGLKGLQQARQYVLHHHEYIDGSGYPDGLSGETIPLGARVILVADAYDAMTTDRPYRKAIGHRAAIDELRKKSGQQFDTEAVNALISAIGENAEKLEASLSEASLELSLPAIDPKQTGKHFQAEAERQKRRETLKT